MSDSVWYTRPGRLLSNGWQPNAEVLRLVLQREHYWAALAELSAHEGNPDAIPTAISRGDTAGIVQAVTAYGVAQWCNANLQTFASQAAAWDQQLANALSAEIAKDPSALLLSLEGVEDAEGDAELIRAECSGYLDQSAHLFDSRGQRAPAKPSTGYAEPIPRRVRPLVSRDHAERRAAAAEANREAMAADAIRVITSR